MLPAADGMTRTSRPEDVAWDGFLPEESEHEAVAGEPGDPTNILFSSGTTKDPKAIPWTHLTPIKAAADGYFHQDVHPADVLAWPTSFGWMMGPWLTYASLVNGATMALYTGDPQRREFGEFVSKAGVTILGIGGVGKSALAGRAMTRLRDEGWISIAVSGRDRRSFHIFCHGRRRGDCSRGAGAAIVMSNDTLRARRHCDWGHDHEQRAAGGFSGLEIARDLLSAQQFFGVDQWPHAVYWGSG